MEVSAGKVEDILDGQSAVSMENYSKDLLIILESLVPGSKENHFTTKSKDVQDSSLVPFFWISKWVDETRKYGFCYQLCDNTTGVFFNDKTHISLSQDGENLQYIQRDNEIQCCTLEDYPQELRKKIKIFNFLNDYIKKNLVAAGEGTKAKDVDDMIQVPLLQAWFRVRTAMIFYLSNGTFQVNFFKDKTKMILCPFTDTVSLIDKDNNFTVYTFQFILESGCPPLLASRLLYSKNMVEKLYKDYPMGNVDAVHQGW